MPPDLTPLRNGHDPHFVPPSKDLEQFLLAALLTDNRRLADVGSLQPEHFGYEAHSRIFEIIRHLVADNLPATPHTMTHMVAGDPNLVGATDYLKTLASSVVSYTPHAVAHYANELIALQTQRSLVALGNDLGRIFLDAQQPSFGDRVEAAFAEFETLKGKWQRDHAAKTGFACLDFLQLEDDQMTGRRWLVPDWLPMGETCGLGGTGGEGKTLLAHQLATVAALGYGEWLGMKVTPMKAALVLCEDNINDTHWRQAKINRLYGCHMADLHGELFALPRREAEDNYLATFDRDSNMKLTDFFHQLLDELKRFQARLVVLDTLMDVFRGDQNNPAHARKFIRGCCDRIARELDGIVLLVYHPSRAGMSDGTGMSGTVQWDAGFGARLFMNRPQDKDDDDTADTRVLSLIKTNLAPPTEAIKINWQDGAFVRKPVDDSLTYKAQLSKADRIFEQLFEQYTQQGRNLSATPGPTYAPALFAADPEGNGVPNSKFRDAMNKAFKAGKIKVDPKTNRLAKVV